MNRYYYDLHLHSCLSPCGDEDMTPNNIAGMATLCGLNIVALTDHNTSKNCPAFFKAAQKNGIIPVAGMELTTSEEIHAVCLFEHLEQAMEFDKAVESRLMKIKNRPEIFGEQLILDENDEVIGSYDNLLITATDISIEELPEFVKSFGGVCWPAHIDRLANGIIAVLGTFPETPFFGCAELRDIEKLEETKSTHPAVQGCFIMSSSDAHRLEDMRDKSLFFELDDEPYSSAKVRSELFKMLKKAMSGENS